MSSLKKPACKCLKLNNNDKFTKTHNLFYLLIEFCFRVWLKLPQNPSIQSKTQITCI